MGLHIFFFFLHPVTLLYWLEINPVNAQSPAALGLAPGMPSVLNCSQPLSKDANIVPPLRIKLPLHHLHHGRTRRTQQSSGSHHAGCCTYTLQGTVPKHFLSMQIRHQHVGFSKPFVQLGSWHAGNLRPHNSVAELKIEPKSQEANAEP